MLSCFDISFIIPCIAQKHTYHMICHIMFDYLIVSMCQWVHQYIYIRPTYTLFLTLYHASFTIQKYSMSYDFSNYLKPTCKRKTYTWMRTQIVMTSGMNWFWYVQYRLYIIHAHFLTYWHKPKQLISYSFNSSEIWTCLHIDLHSSKK